MCRVLYRAVDNFYPDPTQDEVQSYKIGDVIAVEPDGTVFSVNEVPPNYGIVDFPGIHRRKMVYLTATHTESTAKLLPEHVMRNPILFTQMRKGLRPHIMHPARYNINPTTKSIADKEWK